MTLGRYVSWLLVATAVLVTIATMALVVTFRHRAGASREELQGLMRVESEVNALSALEWQAMAQGEVSPAVRQRATTAIAEARRELEAITDGDTAGGEVELRGTFDQYADAVEAQFALVEEGRIDEAHEIDETLVDPLYEELHSATHEEIDEHETKAGAARRNADIGMVIIIAVGAITGGGLLWGQEALRRRAQLAVAAQEKLTAVQESEEKFREMVEDLSEIIYVLDARGVFVYVSPAIKTVGGYEPSDVLGKPFAQFISAEDLPLTLDSLKRVIDGAPEPLEFRAVSASGQVRWVRSSSSPIIEDGVVVGVRGVLMDITDVKTTQQDLRQTNATLQAIVDSSPVAIVAIHPDDRVFMWNRAAWNLFGWREDEVLGQSYPLIPPGGESEYRSLMQKILAGGEFRGIEAKRRRRDGSLLDVAISAASIRDASGNITGALAIIADITDRKQAEETIRHLAYHDALTGLPNRALFTDRLEVALAQARRSAQSLAVLYLDLDHFKVVNDTVGHGAGDILLTEVADRLRGLVREADTVARVGGDEFAILLAPPVGAKEANEIAGRIIAELRGPWVYGDAEFTVSGSMGIALYPIDATDPGLLMKAADLAMYATKNNGRDGFKVYQPSMNETVESRLALERDLQRAIREKEFVVYYQPQIDVRTGRIAGMEALVRWQHPQRGLLLPGEFLPLAEEMGAIVQIDEIVLETAARQLAEWHAMGNTQMTMAVNLSALHFGTQGFIRKMAALLRRTGIQPSRLLIEITETVAMHQSRRTLRVLGALKRLGFGVVIDDFGTGHSSLTYLRRFPVDAIKIDRSFISGIGRSSADEALVTAIIALAHSLNLDVVAEGVETEEQFAFLKDLRSGNLQERQRGCDYFQGYLSSRPVPASAIEALLNSETATATAG